MTDEQVKNGFNDVYNHFWMQYKRAVPERDSDEWDRMYARMEELQLLYPFMSEVMRNMVIELDERMRGRGYGKIL